jgi:hypothetical protein
MQRKQRLLLIRILLFEELQISFVEVLEWSKAYLDESLGGLEEVLLSLGLGTLGVPVDDCLIRDTVRVVQHLENLSEGLHESGVGVAVDLGRVDESNFGLGAFAEGFEDRSSSLRSAKCHRGGHTLRSWTTAPSI